jgi:peptide/nickel transport system substrate-binding protein
MSFSIWKGEDIPPKLYPLMGEPDYAKRMEGFKTFDMWQVEQGYSIPLFLGLSTIVAKRSLGFRPYKSGILIPYDWA